MVTLKLTQAEAAFRQELLSRRLAGILEKLQAGIATESETLSYRRDLIVFLGDKIHICTTQHALELDPHRGSQ